MFKVPTTTAKPAGRGARTPILEVPPQRNHRPGAMRGNPATELQRTIGNQAVLRMLRPNAAGVDDPGDRFEEEADRIAEQVIRAPSPRAAATALAPVPPGLQRKCDCGGTCAKCRTQSSHDHEHERLQLKRVDGSSGAPPAAAPPIVHDVVRTPGQSLDPATRAFMEPQFGHDFSQVRVHTDATAAESAKALHARAYTVGSHVAFAGNQFSPATTEGRRLLAHELAHVVQQRGGATAVQRAPDNDDDDEPVRARPTSCPGGAMPINGVCLTDAVMDALPSADFDLKRADGIAKRRESAVVKQRNRSEQTEKKYAKKSPSGLSQAYEHVLKQYSSDPEWRKKYDLETLQKIVQEQLPKAATVHSQDVREDLSASTWTAGEQVELDKLKEDIKGWTQEEQELARYLLWNWFELAEKGRSPLAAKKVIIEMTYRHLEQWLRLADKARDEECRRSPPGFVEKLYRLHGNDRCKPWFGEVFDSWYHGPSELMHFRRQMQLRLTEDDSPRTLVFMCVEQYRRQTNQDEQLKRLRGQAFASMLTHVASVGAMGSTPQVEAPEPGIVAEEQPVVVGPAEPEFDVRGDVTPGREARVIRGEDDPRVQGAYVNNNPRATASELDNGAFLDGKARAGELKGVVGVEGAPEAEVRSGDYRFITPDGSRIGADLQEPETNIPSRIVGRIFKKSGQANVVVIKLGRGSSNELTDVQANSVADDVVRTPGLSIDRVIVIRNGVIIVDKSR